jgi:hypothetical protein
MKVAELEGALLDAWVARAEGYDVVPAPTDPQGCWVDTGGTPFPFRPSTDWSQGGQIIEREQIAIETGGEGKYNPRPPTWYAICDGIFDYGHHHQGEGPTPLIAAMRAYVASKFGEEVPDS